MKCVVLCLMCCELCFWLQCACASWSIAVFVLLVTVCCIACCVAHNVFLVDEKASLVDGEG